MPVALQAQALSNHVLGNLLGHLLASHCSHVGMTKFKKWHALRCMRANVAMWFKGNQRLSSFQNSVNGIPGPVN